MKSSELIQQLQQFDTCTISNAIEHFQVRTRNEGFVNGAVRCLFPSLGVRCGYAVTARIRTAATPMAGSYYFDHPDWWDYVSSAPAPKFLAIQDIDDPQGIGALFGEIHAAIGTALGCTAYLTNGAVRDLPGIESSGMQTFAASLSVSHAYAHIVEYNVPVEIGGLSIQPGDLLHGDEHGVLQIPASIAEQLPAQAGRVVEYENELLSFCRSRQFSVKELQHRIQHSAGRTTLS